MTFAHNFQFCHERRSKYDWRYFQMSTEACYRALAPAGHYEPSRWLPTHPSLIFEFVPKFSWSRKICFGQKSKNLVKNRNFFVHFFRDRPWISLYVFASAIVSPTPMEWPSIISQLLITLWTSPKNRFVISGPFSLKVTWISDPAEAPRVFLQTIPQMWTPLTTCQKNIFRMSIKWK